MEVSNTYIYIFVNNKIKQMNNNELKSETRIEAAIDGNIVLCAGREYKTKFKKGDRVTAQGYCGVLVLDSVDELLTFMLDKLHWNTTSETYLQGKSKTNNGESYPESELSPCT